MSVRASPSRGGLGAFADNPVLAGTFLGVYEGKTSTRCGEENEYFFAVAEEAGIDGCEGGGWTAFMNHEGGEGRNVEARVVGREEGRVVTVVAEDGGFAEVDLADVEGGWAGNKRVEFWTRRRVEAGEELLFHYGKEFGDWLDRDR